MPSQTGLGKQGQHCTLCAHSSFALMHDKTVARPTVTWPQDTVCVLVGMIDKCTSTVLKASAGKACTQLLQAGQQEEPPLRLLVQSHKVCDSVTAGLNTFRAYLHVWRPCGHANAHAWRRQTLMRTHKDILCCEPPPPKTV